MGLIFMDIKPIPHLTSPLKGEEQEKLAHMGAGRNDELMVYLKACGVGTFLCPPYVLNHCGNQLAGD
jgi:hypothetical protein